MSDDMEKYYREHGRKVYLYLMSMCRDSDLAEELTQETFYQAIKSLPKYRGDCSVYTWLCGIAKNVWRRELKRQRKAPVADPDPEQEDSAPPPDRLAEAKDGKLRLMKRIHQLPETEKEIVLLRATGELSFREIGEILGMTENCARVTFYRAKNKLKGD